MIRAWEFLKIRQTETGMLELVLIRIDGDKTYEVSSEILLTQHLITAIECGDAEPTVITGFIEMIHQRLEALMDGYRGGADA